MNEATTIQVRDFTGGPFAVSAEDGQRLHDQIAPLLRAGTPVALSFAGIDAAIGAFLSAALGQLCAGIPEARLGALLTFRDMPADDRATVERSMRSARSYYANPGAYDAAWKQELEDTATICATLAEQEN